MMKSFMPCVIPASIFTPSTGLRDGVAVRDVYESLRAAAGRTSDARRVIKPDVRTAAETCPRRLRRTHQSLNCGPHAVALMHGIKWQRFLQRSPRDALSKSRLRSEGVYARLALDAVWSL